ncbi:MAG: hypothetical protein ACUVWX_14985 [Kiritimatiellia bacterium]
MMVPLRLKGGVPRRYAEIARYCMEKFTAQQHEQAHMAGDPGRTEAIEPCGDRIGNDGCLEQQFFNWRAR